MRLTPRFLARIAPLTCALLAILWAATAAAELKLPAMFSSGAVLQQGIALPVWGWADPGAEVKVSFAGQTKTAKAKADGKWSVKLDALPMNKEPAVLTVAAGDAELKVENVLVGEVWFCSGQSNMEWTVGAILPETVKPGELALIRHIKVPHVKAPEPADDFKGTWQVCSDATVRGFTAVGFFFAYQLEKELDTPVGLIGCNWGGTRIEPWTPPEGFAQVKEQLDPATIRDGSTMYNGMAAAVQPYAIRGALWYQGESNGGEGESYFWKMKALVEGWRITWDQGEFPFYFVQLANFRNPNPEPAGGDGWAKLRDAQLKTILEVPQTGMAVIIDVGESNDIHPKNKFDVGRRLALWALAKDYDKQDLVHSGPIYKSLKVEDGKVRLSFDHVGGGLMAAKKDDPRSINAPPAEKLEGFAIAGEDKTWAWADAIIDGDTVVVSAADVKQPVAVRYAFSMHPDKANLYNKEGLPASPFRTDSW